MSEEKAVCKLCGEPMPPGEEMFYYHGYSGDCPKPPLPTQELLPCPFCGGAAEYDTGDDWRVVRCSNGPTCPGWYACAESEHRWNRRTPDAASEKVRREVAAQAGGIVAKLRQEHAYYSEHTPIAAFGQYADDVEALRAKLLEGIEADG